MKPLRLLALAIAATAWCASAAFACDGAKASAASAASCGTKSASVKSADACGSKSTAVTAVAASASKKGAHAAGADCPASASCPMTGDACKAMMASGACTAEMQAACAAKGAKTASAAKASKSAKAAGMDCCATGAKGAKTTAMDGCGMGAKTAGADGCSMHTMAGHAGMDCAVCADEMACDDDVKATGARAQVVPLRNGSMIVYMLDGDENVRGLQAAVARHNSRVVAALQGDAKLCTACKKLRGALASGKLHREVVNVERGCQVLITSSDRSIVEQVHRCTNAQVAARTKT
jgi:hypothetical protein